MSCFAPDFLMPSIAAWSFARTRLVFISWGWGHVVRETRREIIIAGPCLVHDPKYDFLIVPKASR